VSAGGKNARIQAGNHRLPFTFILPPTVPSSFESEVGYVRYTAEATMERPSKFNHVTRSAFTVINIVDLNMEPMEFMVIVFLHFRIGDQGGICREGGMPSLSPSLVPISSTPLIGNLPS